MTCAHCPTNSPMTVKGRDCCELRRMAQLPRKALEAIATRMTATEKDELRPRLAAEKQRLKGLKVKK